MTAPCARCRGRCGAVAYQTPPLEADAAYAAGDGGRRGVPVHRGGAL